MRLLSILLLSLLSFGTMAQNPNAKLAGDWQGILSVGEKSYKVIFHIKFENDTLSATLDSPDQSAFGLKVDEVSLKDGVVKMKSNVVQGTYEGTIDGKKIEGKWTQGGQTFDLNLEKKGTS